MDLCNSVVCMERAKHSVYAATAVSCSKYRCQLSARQQVDAWYMGLGTPVCTTTVLGPGSKGGVSSYTRLMETGALVRPEPPVATICKL